MMIRAVLFDLAGTLIRAAHPAEIIRRILEKHGVKRPIEEIALAHRGVEEDASLGDYELPYYDFWVNWNKKILQRLQIYEKTDFLARALVDEWWDNADLEIYPDVEETLAELKNMGLKLGVITNAFEEDIVEIFKRVKAPQVFDIYVGIDTVKRPKPNPEIFLHALQALEVRPRETIYVGDDLERDYIGALRAGLKAILIDRNFAYSDRQDLIKIRRLHELLSFIILG